MHVRRESAACREAGCWGWKCQRPPPVCGPELGTAEGTAACPVRLLRSGRWPSPASVHKALPLATG